jgi:UDPglucose 6-dehydrogenase
LRAQGLSLRMENVQKALRWTVSRTRKERISKKLPVFDGGRTVTNSRRIAVIGTGYVGLTAAACFASMRHDVTCADISVARVEQLSRGEVPFLEADLPELIEMTVAKGRLRFTNSNLEAVAKAEFVFLCLPTPEGADGNADLSAVEDVAREIGPHLTPNAIVINKSTVPVGTAFLVRDLLCRPDVHVVSNPEFLAEGTAVSDFLKPDRIVIGAETPEVGNRVAELYGSTLDLNCIVIDIPSAELIKYASNAYLATRLTFINSIAEYCEVIGADIRTVAVGMGADRRIGPAFLSAGPGWGGSCFPKDTQALLGMTENAGCELTLVKTAVAVNERHIGKIASKVESAAGGSLLGKVVAVWGLAFKAGTDDTRSSPALKIVEMLRGMGASIQAYDPAVRHAPEGVRLFASKEEACIDADVLLVTTEWPEFSRANLWDIGRMMACRTVVDARNIISAKGAREADFEYVGVGTRSVKRLAEDLAK